MRSFRFGRFEYLVSLGCLAMLGYFAWYAIDGSRGLQFRDKLALQRASLENELTEVRGKRLALEQRVVHLRPESVDADLADEMARRLLSVGKSNELLVRLP